MIYIDNKKVIISELSLVVITIIWGLGFPITEIAINYGFGANTIMVGRFLTASILLTIVYFKRLKNINKELLLYGIITGVFLFLGFYFQTLGNAFTTASKNGFITQLNIVFVPLLYFLFFKKKVDLYNVLSVIIAVIGMFVLAEVGLNVLHINIGDFYTFICAIMVAFNVVTGSFFQKKYDFDPALFVLINIYTAMVFSVIAMILFEEVPILTMNNVWPLVFLGVLNTALGFLVQSYTLKISIPTRVSLIVALESVFSAIGSVILLQEVLGVSVLFGGSLIIFAVIFNEIKPFKKKKVVFDMEV